MRTAQQAGQLAERDLAPLTLQLDTLFESAMQPLESHSSLRLPADTLSATLGRALDVPSDTTPTTEP